jgi:ferritin-like protein
MAAGSTTLHEDPARLGSKVIDRHRAIVSLMEELEAADWYDQRVHACDDAELKKILAHNRDEEKEHASMLLEWLRRHDKAMNEHLSTYLFTEEPIIEIEEEKDEEEEAPKAKDGGGKSGGADHGSLGIGSLKE